MKDKSVDFWDRLGVGISAICVVHCLFFPLLVAVLPIWSLNSTLHSWAHPVFFILIVPTVYFAIRKGRGNMYVAALLLAGVFLLAVAWVMHDILGATGELIVTLVGSVFLIIGHVKNYHVHVVKRKKQSSFNT